MAHRIEVRSKIADTRARVREQKLKNMGFDVRVVELVDVYTIDKELSHQALQNCADLFANPVVQNVSIDTYCAPNAYDWAIEIGFLPGVTDNVATTARETIEDKLKKQFIPSENVYTSQTVYVQGALSHEQAQQIAESLANPLIQRIHVKSKHEMEHSQGMGIIVPRVKLSSVPHIDTVNLDVDDHELAKIGKQGIADYDAGGKEIGRRGPLALDLASMHAIRDYFREQKRNPTDIELESIAQTWSEHCKHTYFLAQIDDIDSLYKTFIKRATNEIRKKKGDKDFCVSVFSDNSGAIIFDDEFIITHKVETHNSPSALDPYGGSITGIVGVNRDAIGFGKGAKPIINTYGFCFGHHEDKRVLYRGKNKTNPALLPERIMEGVIEGVRVGGNCSGIPTPQGFVYFDERYRGKPLVFVGTVGLIPKNVNNQPSHEKKAQSGDYIVMVGGRVGLDGIHGATFSSEAMDSGSPATAVQIGDPITQKKLSDALVKEARDFGLYNSITDNGAGGLSCSVAEMARESNGCKVYLDKVPTKYLGIEPWQIWISESQERMTLAVPKENLNALLDLMKRRGVEATVIGNFTDSGKCIVDYQGQNIMDVDLKFLHEGVPQKKLTSTFTRGGELEPDIPKLDDLTEQLHALLNRHNVCSKEFISVQYDHEVQAGSVVKPLQGKGRVQGDATITRPRLESYKGIALSQALFPSYSDIDTYNMAAAAIDASIRNIIAVGGTLDKLALLDNFCWCSSDDPERLGQLKRAVQACYDTAVAYGTPFISGKDSMFNDFKGYDDNNNANKISVPPTLLISSINVIDDVKKCVTMDFKAKGDVIYVLGETKDEFGGSEYYAMLGEQMRGKRFVGNNVPTVDPQKNITLYNALSKAINHELVASAHAVGIGGLAASLAKCSIAGQLGANIEITGDEAQRVLFSESTGRFVVSVNQKNAQAFEEIISGCGTVYKAGTVSDNKFIINHEGKTVIQTDVQTLEQHYKERFAKY